jgi:hypothetical protein
MENFIDNGEVWMKELLNFRNWLYEIRQQTNQYVPKHLGLNGVKFGSFLLKTRWEILTKLLDMQKRLPIKLISSDELHYIRELLGKESEGKVKQGLKRFVFELPNSQRLSVISDFNVLLTLRKRLGPLHLKQAKLVRSRTISSNYSLSTRVMYYMM